MDWTKREVRIIIEDYFNMLLQELKNEKYNKTFHRELILPKLEDRSNSSIEFKHQNISAILSKMGIPFIKGYKPRHNYQQLLEDETQDYFLKHRNALEPLFESFSNQSIFVAENIRFEFENLLDTFEPEPTLVKEPEPTYKPVRVNFLEKEQNNRNLGEQGEKLVIEYEKWRLINSGKENLAEKIEWISKDVGDGTGFDILSKNNNGTDRYIEVKTTKLTKETPIYFSRNEFLFAKSKGKDFFLYRVFNFTEKPRMFIKQGEYEKFCSSLQTHTYKGYF